MNTENRILAINPGSRFMGFAVLEGAELRDWAVRSVIGESTEKKKRSVERLVRTMSEKNNCQVIAIKSPVNRSTETLKMLTTTVERTARSLDMDCMRFSISDMKRSILGTSRSNKNRLVDEVALRYPFLSHEQARVRKSRSLHFLRMFEAVAVGMLCAAAVDLTREESKGRKKKM